ncbi:MAG TPA: helical backbone metal receptor [Pyrinomonadaceae bacterium]|nr:helical backbone metal receptor [Pyrinomonadaceae bacterium]
MIITRLFALLLACSLLFAGCSGGPGSVNSAGTGVEKAPQRIVSLSPNVTEILYGIGAWPQVIAVSEYCSYPDDVKNKPRVNGWDRTNLEQVVALKPDFVIGVEAQEPFVREKLDGLGVKSLFLKGQKLADVLRSIVEIGRATGHEAAAVELSTKTEGEIEQVRQTVANLPRPRVLCVIDRLPGTIRDLYTATRGSYIDELLQIAGGEPVAPPGQEGYGKITKEAVLSLNPEVIIDMVQGSKGKFGEDPISVWDELAEVAAVRNKRIYPMTDEWVIHPSQFVGQTAKTFARVLHPEKFADGQ